MTTYAEKTPAWIDQFDGILDGPSPFSYGAGEPPAGWVPFNASSKFNIPIPASPAVAADSAAVVAWLNSLGGPVDRYMGTGGTVEDYGHPWYFTAAGDPRLRVKRRGIDSGGSPTAKNPNAVYTPAASIPVSARKIGLVQNRLIRVPALAKAAGGDDGHMALLTATHSYEFHKAQYANVGEGRLGTWSASVFDLAGDGTPMGFGAATASGVSLLSGQIRLADLEAGHIPHAIAIITKSVRRNVFLAPANGCATSDVTTTAGDANDLKRPVTGSRLQLAYTKAEIQALAVPPAMKVIYEAMREFGMIIMDTGGSSFGIQMESGAMDVAQGKTDRWKVWAEKEGLSKEGGFHVLPLKAGVDWANKLRFVNV